MNNTLFELTYDTYNKYYDECMPDLKKIKDISELILIFKNNIDELLEHLKNDPVFIGALNNVGFISKDRLNKKELAKLQNFALINDIYCYKINNLDKLSSEELRDIRTLAFTLWQQVDIESIKDKYPVLYKELKSAIDKRSRLLKKQAQSKKQAKERRKQCQLEKARKLLRENGEIPSPD